MLAILILGGLLAGCTALDGVARGAIIPGILGPEYLRAGIDLQLRHVSGDRDHRARARRLLIVLLGGRNDLAGVRWMYLFDAFSCVGMLVAALAIGPQPPHNSEGHPPVGKAIAEGLRFVVSNKALAGLVRDRHQRDAVRDAASAVRRALAHASTTPERAAPGCSTPRSPIGGTVSVLASGWVQRVNRLGRLTIAMVLVWGLAIGGAGLVRTIVPAAILLGVAGWADGLSAVCRSTISQTVTPDRLRGRMSSVFSLVVTSGPRLGDIESGLVAGLAGALNSVLIGGIGCLVGVGVTRARLSRSSPPMRQTSRWRGCSVKPPPKRLSERSGADPLAVRRSRV